MQLKPLTLSLGCLILSSTCVGQTANWIQIQPKNSPSGRWQHAMSYDFVSGRTVLFGGRPVGNAYMNDTWEYDGKDWAQIKTAGAPTGRWLSGMVYNRGRLRSVMFGGLGSGGTYFADTWVYDSIKKTWTQMKPKNSPSGRYVPGMTYDSARNRVVLFGGQLRGSKGADTWEWDGADWTQIKTQNAPTPRGNVAMAYDSARKVVVLYGGTDSGRTRETWEYDGKDWTKITTTNSPSAYCCAFIGYDAARQRVVIFGGFTPNNNETWEYDGKDWTRIKTATPPSPRRDTGNQMVYDSRRGRMVLFGGSGNLGDTWEYVATQALTGSPPTISIATGGTHAFNLDAGTAHASRLYWIFGSVTGTSPGVTLASPAGSVNIPLNPDFWTDITIGLANSALLTKTRGSLDGSGKGSAAFHVPKITNQSAIGVKFYHAFLVYDAQSNFYMASNPVELTLAK